MPPTVTPTSCSSLCAGTTTATRLPSTTALGGRRAAADARDHRIPGERGDQTEHEADQRADEQRAADAPRRRVHGRGPRDDTGALDQLRDDEQLLRRRARVEQRRATLLEDVLSADQHELFEGRVALRLQSARESLLVAVDRSERRGLRGELRGERAALQI